MAMYDFNSLMGEDDDNDYTKWLDPRRIGTNMAGLGHSIMQSPMYQSTFSGMDEADPGDPAVQQYMHDAQKPMPSQEMYSNYAGSRPEEEAYQQGGFWRKLGAGFLSLGGKQGQYAARELLHPGFSRAYEDWQTEGKFLPQMARSADTARTKELEAEKFNITAAARRRTAEETERKNKETEKARTAKAEADRVKQEEADRIRDAREERAIAASERSARAAELREENNRRSEQRLTDAEERTRVGNIDKSYADRTKDFKSQEKDIEKQVMDDFLANPRNKDNYVVTKSGKTIIDPSVRKQIQDEIQRRKDKARPMKIEFDSSNDVEEPNFGPNPAPMSIEPEPWYKRIFGG